MANILPAIHPVSAHSGSARGHLELFAVGNPTTAAQPVARPYFYASPVLGVNFR